MNFLMAIGTWFGQNILTKPEFFVGLLVFVGYLFLGKKIYEAVTTTYQFTCGCAQAPCGGAPCFG